MQQNKISSNLQSLVKNSIFSLDHDTGINCDGSFRIFQGNTSVTCSIFGPRESTTQKKSFERGAVEVQIKQFSDLTMKELRYHEHRIRLFLEEMIALEKYPRFLTTFVLVIHNDDGSLFSSMLNACMLAMLFNGISLRQTVWSIDVSLLEDKSEKSICLYPSKVQEKSGINTVQLGLDLVQSKVSTVDTEGFLDGGLFDAIYNCADQLVPVLRESIKRYIAEIVFE